MQYHPVMLILCTFAGLSHAGPSLVPTNPQYLSQLPDCLGSIFDCNSTIPSCRNLAGFEFDTLWDITTQYAEQCPGGPWLFRDEGEPNGVASDELGLTNEICEAIAGPSWTRRVGNDIWTGLTLWKIPLTQLVVNSPRAPLGVIVETFIFVRIFGDPIGTISHLMKKLDSCQMRATFWQDQLENGPASAVVGPQNPGSDDLWKSLSIIVDSYDDWGYEIGDRVQDYLRDALIRFSNTDSQALLNICRQTASALSADRATSYVPIAVAELFFISSIAIAMIQVRVNSQGPNPTTFISPQIYGMAFTAQYFWAIFTVLCFSVIGVSQTTTSLTTILERFRADVETELGQHTMTIHIPFVEATDDRRRYHGGIYSWQPARQWPVGTRSEGIERSPSSSSMQSGGVRPLTRITSRLSKSLMHVILPFTVVTAAAVTGQLISALVPPEGWSCRSFGMLCMYVTWVTSYMIGLCPFTHKYRRLYFWVTFLKDSISACITSGIVIYTQVGIYQSCNCYTSKGKFPLQLPMMPAIAEVLQTRLGGAFAGVVASGIALQLVLLPCLPLWRYRTAVRVYSMRG